MATNEHKKAHKKRARKGKQTQKPLTQFLSLYEHDKAPGDKTNGNSTVIPLVQENHSPATASKTNINTKMVINVESTENQNDNSNEKGLLGNSYLPHSASPEPEALASNPYLNREKCLLCQRNRTVDDESDSEDEELKIGPHNYALSKMSLWVCSKCKTTLEEEEKKGESEPVFFNDEESAKLLSGVTLPSNGFGEVEQKLCECEACKDRRQIEQEQDDENSLLQLCWTDLLHAIRCVYRESNKCLMENGGTVDRDKCKQHVARLCSRDSHQLFQRLESHSIDYILELKVKVLQQLTADHRTTPEKAKAVIGTMLNEYYSLCSSAKILSDIFKQLEIHHLKRFVFTWELHDKHLFRNIVYADSVIENALPMLVTQLRLGASSKELKSEDCFPSLLSKYMKFEDDMSVVNAVWRDCQMRLDQYADEQAAIQAKQRMLREDWEFFSAQRKILKDQIMKNHEQLATRPLKPSDIESPIPSPPPLRTSLDSLATSMAPGSHKCIESQFSDAMRSLLEESATRQEPFTCPNCYKQRCPCHECSISHLITCGILAPELQDTLLPMGTDGNCSASTNPFSITPTSTGFDMSVKPPSFSSSYSSSDAGSDELGSDCDSPDSWEEKLRRDPKLNLFEHFLEEQERAKLKAEAAKAQLQDAAPNNLSDPSPCQCHECKRPAACLHNIPAASPDSNSATPATTVITTGHSSAFSANVPVSHIPKPAAFHLYPHIHGSRVGGLDPAHLGAARLSSAQSLIQPHLYNLHNQNPELVKQLEKLKQKRSNSAFNPPFSDSSPVSPPCLRDQIKTSRSCPSSDSSASTFPSLNGVNIGQSFPACTSFSNYSTTRVNQSDLLLAPPPPVFNPSAFSFDPMVTANVPLISNLASRASTLHPWQLMKQQVHPSCRQAYPHVADSDTPHEHTEECFKNLPGPFNHLKTGSQSTVKSEQADRIVPSASTTKTSTSASATHLSGTERMCVPPQPTLYPVTNCGTNSIQQQPVSTLINNAKVKTSCHHTTPQKTKTIATANNVNSNKPTNKSAHQTVLPVSQQSGETDGGGCLAHSEDEDGDSCSGQSSSTSTSNQKDSKYCDCCYCEFFGHGQPTPLPTSKNYAEIRERLRSRLKKKNQKLTPCSKGHDLVPISTLEAVTAAATPSLKSAAILAASHSLPVNTNKSPASATTQPAEGTIGNRDLSELLKYITGEEINTWDSQKLDKKQRRKLKKAERKARRMQQVKQLPRVDSKSAANSDSDADSDSEKITAQTQNMSSRHQTSAKTENAADRHNSQQRQSKKQSNAKKDNQKRVTSSSPDNERAKSAQASLPKTQPNDVLKSSKSISNISSHSEPARRNTLPNNAKSSQARTSNSGCNQNLTQNDQSTGGAGYNTLQDSHLSRSNNNRYPANTKKQLNISDKRKRLIENVSPTPATSIDDRKLNHAINKTPAKRAPNSQRLQPEGQESTPSQQSSHNHNGDIYNVTCGRGQRNHSIPSHQEQRMGRKKSGKKEKFEDDIFLPMDDEEVEEHDQFAKELNDFKRFVLSEPAPEAPKISVNLNMKDVQVVKRKGLTC